MENNKDLEQLRQLRLSELNEVRHLDKIGANGKDCALLVYIDNNNPVIYGVDDLPTDPNTLIEHLIMRNYGITKAEAVIKCIIDQPSLIVEDLTIMMVYIYNYVTYH